MLNTQPGIVTVGGGEIAHIAYCPKLPESCETVPARETIISVSGKGACQAATMAQLGGNIYLLSCIGNDKNGDSVVSSLKKSNVNTDLCYRTDHPTATSLIMVDYEGETIKSYFPGANLKLTAEMAKEAKGIISGADLLVCQLEIHNSVLEYVIATASKFGVPVVLNSSPALPYDYNLYSDISTLVMNHIEAEYYTGREIMTVDDARKSASMILDDGVKSVVITLAGLGCIVADHTSCTHITPPEVRAIDSCSAGDVFTGALSWSLACGSTLESAADFACKAAAMSITQKGMIESVPTLDDITSKFAHSVEELLNI